MEAAKRQLEYWKRVRDLHLGLAQEIAENGNPTRQAAFIGHLDHAETASGKVSFWLRALRELKEFEE